MTERGILFKAEMVRAIRKGQKTQTRRIVKDAKGAFWDHGGWRPEFTPQGFVWKSVDGSAPDVTTGAPSPRCRYGMPGDRLWVRETWSPDFVQDVYPFAAGVWYRADFSKYEDPTREKHSCVDHGKKPEITDCLLCRNHHEGHTFRWRPAIHMPRRHSRILLEVTSVRVERLQDISEADAAAEGVEITPPRLVHGHVASMSARENFQVLWDAINGKAKPGRPAYPWASNPWLWCISFRRIDGKAQAAA